MQAQAIGVFPAHSGPVLAVVWPKEDMIVTGSTDESLRSWKLDLVHETLGKEKEIILQEKLLTKDTVATAHALGVQSIAFDQKGARIASIGIGSDIAIWDSASLTPVGSIQATSMEVFSVTWIPGEDAIVTGSRRGHVNVWDLSQSRKQDEPVIARRAGIGGVTEGGSGSMVMCVACSPTEKLVVSGHVDGTVCLYDLSSSKVVAKIVAQDQCIRSVCFSADGLKLFAAGDAGTITCFSTSAATSEGLLSITKVIPAHKGSIYALSTPQRGDYLVSASADHKVRIWNTSNNLVVRESNELKEPVWSVAFAPFPATSKQLRLVAGGESGRINLIQHTLS